MVAEATDRFEHGAERKGVHGYAAACPRRPRSTCRVLGDLASSVTSRVLPSPVSPRIVMMAATSAALRRSLRGQRRPTRIGDATRPVA